jgi:long-chain acyl-CoA synthetase
VGFWHDLRETSATFAERVAVVTDRDKLTFGEMIAQSDSIASHFLAAGVRPGNYVGIALQDSLEALLAIFACWRISATAAVIDFRMPRVQRAAMARDFTLSVVLENARVPGEGNYPSATFDQNWRFVPAVGTPLPPAGDDSHPAFLLFSSGTTGTPKAYIQGHDIVSARISARKTLLDAGERRYLTPMALTYSATRHQILGYLINGGTVRLAPPLFTPSELAEELLAFGASGTALPPPVIARLIREAGVRSEPLFPKLAVLASIGGPARGEDKVAAYQNLTNGYRISYASGLTGTITALSGPDVLRKPETTGRPVPATRVAIIDKSGAELPTGATGRIKAWTKWMTPSMLLPGGIVGIDPETMGPDWGIPGDLGYFDDEQFLTIVDREADVIVRGGVNVAPLEIEKILMRHPKVTEAAVVGFPDEIMGQEIAAFIVGESAAVDDIAHFVRTNIAPDRRPREIRVVPALPYSEHGKLMRRRLVEMLAPRSAPGNTDKPR